LYQLRSAKFSGGCLDAHDHLTAKIADPGVLIAEAGAAGPLHLWVPTTFVTWADALPSAVSRPVPGEPVLVRPDVG
jgi:hypothetical protein